LLVMLALGAFAVWYSKLPIEARLLGLREWIHMHVLH
jgi:hypothetical protein